jgi:membrane-bound lytic murein transglycosylase B
MKSIAILFSALALAAGAHGDALAAPQTTSTQAAMTLAADQDPEHVNFVEWLPVREFIEEMVTQHGFEREALHTLFGQVRFIDRAVQLVKPAPPGKPKNWQAYSARFIEPIRIRAGVRFWNENADALAPMACRPRSSSASSASRPSMAAIPASSACWTA